MQILKQTHKAIFYILGFIMILEIVSRVIVLRKVIADSKKTKPSERQSANETARGDYHALKSMAEFDSSMNKVAGVSEATEKELNELKEKAKKMGTSTEYSANDIARSMASLAYAGAKCKDVLNAINYKDPVGAVIGISKLHDSINSALDQSERYKKHLKRVENRQKLYEKRKALGRV